MKSVAPQFEILDHLRVKQITVVGTCGKSIPWEQFLGDARPADHVPALEHEPRIQQLSHDMAAAGHQAEEILQEIVAKYPEVIALAAVHRTGDLAVGDLAVVVGVSCAHRADAFHACHALIDELKASVPVWKHQRFTDGTDEWVGSA